MSTNWRILAKAILAGSVIINVLIMITALVIEVKEPASKVSEKEIVWEIKSSRYADKTGEYLEELKIEEKDTIYHHIFKIGDFHEY